MINWINFPVQMIIKYLLLASYKQKSKENR